MAHRSLARGVRPAADRLSELRPLKARSGNNFLAARRFDCQGCIQAFTEMLSIHIKTAGRYEGSAPGSIVSRDRGNLCGNEGSAVGLILVFPEGPGSSPCLPIV
jgi:hypothetical protein